MDKELNGETLSIRWPMKYLPPTALTLTEEACKAYLRRQHFHGRVLRKVMLPSLLHAHAAFEYDRYRTLSSVDPYLWDRLPSVLVFGYRQGCVLHALRDPSLPHDREVERAAALFNAAIVVFDYLVDECGMMSELETVVPRDLIRQLLQRDAAAGLSRADRVGGAAADPRVHLLLALMAAWRRLVGLLSDTSATSGRSRRLYRTVLNLFDAETRTLDLQRSGMPATAQHLEVLRQKSAGPTIVTGLISLVAAPDLRSDRVEAFRNVARTVGEVFWLVDDLCDLRADFAQNAPNLVIVRAAQGSDEESPEAFHLHEAVETAAADLRRRLTELDRVLGIAATGDAAAHRVREFVHANVYGWLSSHA